MAFCLVSDVLVLVTKADIIFIFFTVVLCCIRQVDGDPLAFVVLLDFNRLSFYAVKGFKSFDERPVVLGAGTVNASLDNSSTHLKHADPPHNHNYKHDQVEQGQLEDYEEHVHQGQQEDERDEPVDQVNTAVYSSVFRVVLSFEVIESRHEGVVLEQG